MRTFVAIVVAAAFAPWAHAQPAVPPPPADDAARLRDAAEGPDARLAAARALLATDSRDAREAVAALIRDRADTTGARAVLLRAVALTHTAPAALLPGLADALAANPPDPDAPLLAAAIGSVRTPAAVRVLIDTARGTVGTPTAAACSAALRRLTGRDELGDDPRAWAGWFGPLEFVPEPEWRRILAEGLARRADEATREAQSAVARLVEIKRREVIESPAPARSPMLAALLGDALVPLRRLGVELVKRELANGRTVDARATDAAVALLFDKSPEFRIAGAELLTAIAPPEAGQVVTDALLAETHPPAADALLAAAARWPSARVRTAALRWLTNSALASSPPASTAPAGAFSPATRPERPRIDGTIEALAALRRAGLLADPADAAKVAAALRALDDAALSPAAVWLLVQTGDRADRLRVAAWLESPSAADRRAAAEALADDPESLAPILAAAAWDPGLFEAASRAAQTAPTRETLVALARLTAPTPGRRHAALARLAAAAPVADTLAAAGSIQPAAAREATLAALLPLAADPDRAPDQAEEIVTGLTTLAELRLQLGQPAGALDAIDAARPLASGAQRVALRRHAVAALLWLNREAEAREVTLDDPDEADAWLAGLRYAIALPHAGAVAASIQIRLGPRLTPQQRALFERLTGELAGQGAPPTPAALPPASSPPPPPPPP